ncbi:MAG TPA: elongation factor G [Thermoanaerobaculia bacterium]|nr:elongation factor G [Thermoanaerobaculia bacterium]
MQVDSPDLLRNVAVVGHNDTGKTSLTSALLYTSGVTTRLNKVEDGNTITDFDPVEVSREISIGLAPCFAPWSKHKINLIDTPGLGIFVTEMRAGMRAADASLLCVNAIAGVQVTTEKAWQYAEQLGQPVMIHVTKMDRENADFHRVVESLQESFGRTALPLQVPIGSESGFSGVVDLVTEKAYTFERDGDGKPSAGEVPADLAAQVEEWRGQLMETVAESDEALMEAFFEAGELSREQLEAGLRRAVLARDVFPITFSSGLHGIGSAALLDLVIQLLPNPLERGGYPATDVGGQELEIELGADQPPAAIVFKTANDPFSGKITMIRVVNGTMDSDSSYWNPRAEAEERVGHLMLLQGKQGTNTPKLVTGDLAGIAKTKISLTGDTLCSKTSPLNLGWIPMRNPAIAFAIEPKAKGDEEKIGDACHKLIEEDPTLRAARDPQTGDFLLSGTGQLHVEIAVEKLSTRYKVEVILHPPKIPYRETIKRKAEGHGRHKKQSGGRGQFADCKITVEPLPRGEKFEFVDEIFGGSIPQNYRPAVEKGILEACERGYLAGYPVLDFRVRLLDGQYHDVDSSEMAFKIAGSLAFKDAMAKAGATILEPVMQVEITTSEEFMGDIMSDLSQRRGKPQGMEARGSAQVIKAVVPMSEMLNYAPALRSMTQGRSNFTMEYSHYEEVPKPLQEKIIAESKITAAAG